MVPISSHLWDNSNPTYPSTEKSKETVKKKNLKNIWKRNHSNVINIYILYIYIIYIYSYITSSKLLGVPFSIIDDPRPFPKDARHLQSTAARSLLRAPPWHPGDARLPPTAWGGQLGVFCSEKMQKRYSMNLHPFSMLNTPLETLVSE
jgi:hypothetical protein